MGGRVGGWGRSEGLDCVPLLALCGPLEGRVHTVAFFPQCAKTILLILYTFSSPSPRPSPPPPPFLAISVAYCCLGLLTRLSRRPGGGYFPKTPLDGLRSSLRGRGYGPGFSSARRSILQSLGERIKDFSSPVIVVPAAS